jgi:hypothetical protein
MRQPTATEIVARIRANVSDMKAGRITWSEFNARQRAAWDTVIGRPRMHSRVLSVLNRA